MPFTPFHFGPGLAIKSILGSYFSFMLFVFTQVLIDIESGYFLFIHEWPVHRFLHSYVGATAGVIIALTVGKPLCEKALKWWNITAEEDQTAFINPDISWTAAITGASIGVYSHVFLDSIMHSDIRPFTPFTNSNNLLHIISPGELHSICLYSGLAGGAILLLTRTVKGKYK